MKNSRSFFPKILVVLLAFVSPDKLHAQTFSKLENVLKKELPDNVLNDGRWVYFQEKAAIEKLEKPLVKAVLGNYEFYKVTLTNYLGYHVNEGTCVILFDSIQSSIILMEPLWYGGISEPLVQKIIRKTFEDKEQLTAFMDEFNELMEIGSGYKFVSTTSSEDVLHYDLVYLKGDSYTTSGNGISSTIQYTEDGIWRQIEVHLKGLKIVEYVATNPRLKDSKEYKKDYKQVIK